MKAKSKCLGSEGSPSINRRSQEDSDLASLLVVQGSDRGKRFPLSKEPISIGREGSNSIRLIDSEVSRRHAEIRPDQAHGFQIVDLQSANGTIVNGALISRAKLVSGDRVQLGSTVLQFELGSSISDDLTKRVDLMSIASPEDRSAIVKSIPADAGSDVLSSPEATGEWLKVRLANLSVMYQATKAISHIIDLNELLPEILQLVFDSIGADRGAILLTDDQGVPQPRAVRWLDQAVDPDDRMQIPRSIVDHVLREGQGVISANAPGDHRFGPSQSIADYGIREAICVPLRGRHATLGVLYADVQSPADVLMSPFTKNEPHQGRLTPENLMLAVAIGHQAGLAIESTNFYQAKIEAERLAAVGQTIATLSHHIKNIMQGIKGGSYLIETGLEETNEAIIQRGWTIVEKNQNKIYNLVMDMLSYSKEREPALELVDLNEVITEVVELMQARATELGVTLEWHPLAGDAEFLIDPEGIHRAVLNIVTNGLDAAEGRQDARVRINLERVPGKRFLRIRVQDNGIGISEEERATIFQVFSSTKGSRGTGLGLSVSKKIIEEHEGRILVESEVGCGSIFTVELPIREPNDLNDDPLATSVDS